MKIKQMFSKLQLIFQTNKKVAKDQNTKAWVWVNDIILKCVAIAL